MPWLPSAHARKAAQPQAVLRAQNHLLGQPVACDVCSASPASSDFMTSTSVLKRKRGLAARLFTPPLPVRALGKLAQLQLIVSCMDE